MTSVTDYLKGGQNMTEVNCFLEECVHNKNNICTKDVIYLEDEHSCEGGCDEGWDIPEEEEEDE